LTNQDLHVGSRAIRAWIERRQPRLALHGHIHESPDRSGCWAERIGATICINPGPAAGLVLSAVIIETAVLPRGLHHTSRGRIDL
jgi:Icc-related predicted phosphoesterase